MKNKEQKKFIILPDDCPPIKGTLYARGAELIMVGSVHWADAFIKYGDAETNLRAPLSEIQIQKMCVVTEEEAREKAQIIPMDFVKPITQP